MALKDSAGDILKKGITAISDEASQEGQRARSVLRSIAAYPIKLLATFIFGPVLIIRVAWKAENPVRRLIAVVGLAVAIACAYLAVGFLGTMTAAALTLATFGWFAAIGVLLGTTISVYFSVALSILAFNAVCFFFLKMSQQEIINYLKEITQFSSNQGGGQPKQKTTRRRKKAPTKRRKTTVKRRKSPVRKSLI